MRAFTEAAYNRISKSGAMAAALLCIAAEEGRLLLHSICVTMPWKVPIVRGSRMTNKGRAVSDPVRRPGEGTPEGRSPKLFVVSFSGLQLSSASPSVHQLFTA
nr:hypothetical protein CFP56_76545 [Quercus suber]